MSERIPGLDVARALAVGGMLVVHLTLVLSFGREQPEWLHRVMTLLAGRPAMIFMVLAGVGAALRLERAAAGTKGGGGDGMRALLLKRGLFFLGVGFLNLVIWNADILRVYGVSFILLAFVVQLRTRWLMLLGFFFVLASAFMVLTLDYEWEWDWGNLEYEGLWTFEGGIRNLFFNGFRAVLPWTGLMLFGVCLGRLDLSDRRVRGWVFSGALLFWGVAELVSWMLVGYFTRNPYGMDQDTIVALVGTESVPPMPLFLVSSFGFAVVLIVGCLQFTEWLRDWAGFKALAAAGQMAFTWYVGHIVVCVVIAAVGGEEMSMPLPVATAWSVGGIVFMVLLSALYRRWWQRGPLEWILRKVTG